MLVRRLFRRILDGRRLAVPLLYLVWHVLILILTPFVTTTSTMLDHRPSTAISQQGGYGIRTSTAAQYSTVECRDQGDQTFHGLSGVYGFSIVNRSCLYRDLWWDSTVNKFVFQAEDTPANRERLSSKKPFLSDVVNLASRPYDLPILHRKRVIIKRKVGWTFEFAPEVRLGPLPLSELVAAPKPNQVYGYYTPIVAPWNFAHTLFCDLFPLFWMLVEFGLGRRWTCKFLRLRPTTTETFHYRIETRRSICFPAAP